MSEKLALDISAGDIKWGHFFAMSHVSRTMDRYWPVCRCSDEAGARRRDRPLGRIPARHGNVKCKYDVDGLKIEQK